MKIRSVIVMWVVLIVTMVESVLCVREKRASAEPKPGLWQETVTAADGVTVRKIRDTTGGDFNVCYLASRVADAEVGRVPAVSISCVPERKP